MAGSQLQAAWNIKTLTLFDIALQQIICSYFDGRKMFLQKIVTFVAPSMGPFEIAFGPLLLGMMRRSVQIYGILCKTGPAANFGRQSWLVELERKGEKRR